MIIKEAELYCLLENMEQDAIEWLKATQKQPMTKREELAYRNGFQNGFNGLRVWLASAGAIKPDKCKL